VWFHAISSTTPLSRKEKIQNTIYIFLHIGGICILLYWITKNAYIHALQEEKFYIDKENTHLSNLPTWIQPFTTDIIPEKIPNKFCIFNPNITKAISDLYEQNPWVKKTLKIQKCYPNSLKINLALRQPFIYVQNTQKTFDLYDEEGILLKEEVNESFPLPLPILTGFDNVMQQPKNILESTFKLLKILTYHKIYVSHYNLQIATPKQYTILVFKGNQNNIIWGSLDNEDPISLQTKIQRLQKIPPQFLTQSTNTPQEIDLRFHKTIVRPIQIPKKETCHEK